MTMTTVGVFVWLSHVSAVAGIRVGGEGVSFPPELLQQLSTLTTEQNLPGLLDKVPQDMRPMVEKFAPMIAKNPAIFEAIVQQMPNEQQVKIQELVDAVAHDSTLKDVADSKELTQSLQKTAAEQGQSTAQQEKLVGLFEGLAQEVLPTVKEHMADPGFVGKVVEAVVQDGDNLKNLLGVLLGPDHASLLDPLIKFMSLGGTSVLNSLEKQALPTSQAELMDGPLRTIFLVSNLLTYSTLTEEGSAFGPTEQEGKRAYPVVDKHQQVQQTKWLLPEKWMQGIDLICSVLKLKLVALQLQQDGLLLAEESVEGTNETTHLTTTLYTVRMTLEAETTAGKRLIVIHNVRTVTSDDYMNDLTLLMGLYEKPIRKSLGAAKYLSLGDVFYKLGQKLVHWDWLVRKVGLAEDQYVKFLATLDARRKSIRKQLAESIQATTDALKLAEETNTVHLFAGVSLGGAIAQMQGMAAKVKCEACPVVALTINSPSIYHIVHKLKLDPEDTRNKFDQMFSDSILKQKSHLFSGFVNFVAQHGTVWKLDKPLPGSKVCMYMHAAEKTGCRDITNIGDLYRRAYDGFWHCKKDFVKAAEGYDQGECFREQMARILGCVMQEHSFLLAGGFDVKALLVDLSLPKLNKTSTFMDLAKIFSESSVSSRQETIDSLQKETGITRTVAISQHEAKQRNEMRLAMKQKAASNLVQGKIAVSARIDPLVQAADRDYAALPECKGCEEEWCKVKDIREHRCCAVDKGECKNKEGGRSPCDESKDQTCGGVGRFVQNKGRKCKCVTGTCWDGAAAACALDASLARRKDLLKERADLPKLKELQNLWEDFRAEEEVKEWEEQVVKMKIGKGHFVDAEPDPRLDGTWICSQ